MWEMKSKNLTEAPRNIWRSEKGREGQSVCRKLKEKGKNHMNPYIGHPTQLCGVEEHRLVGGKGDGMRLYEVRNGNGLEMKVRDWR